MQETKIAGEIREQRRKPKLREKSELSTGKLELQEKPELSAGN